LDNILPPSVISDAPDSVQTPESDVVPTIPANHPIWRLIADLQVENESLQADNARLTASTDVDSIKARLMRPFAFGSLGFAVLYAISAFALMLCDGFKIGGFNLPENVLNLLVGSTFMAVIGLLSTILIYLFKK
jgi:hypothetical protein